MDVLLMEENRKQREVLREVLVKKGFAVSESRGGLDMLEDMNRFKKDLVVLGYNTWLHNRGTYRYFGVERAWVGIPVVVVNAKRSHEIFSERHPHEKDASLEKPLNMEEFDKIVSSFAGGGEG